MNEREFECERQAGFLSWHTLRWVDLGNAATRAQCKPCWFT